MKTSRKKGTGKGSSEPFQFQLPKENKLTVGIAANDQKDAEQKYARGFLDPTFANAFAAIHCNSTGSGLDLTALMTEMREQVKALENGDLTRIESMLISQAHTLQAIFVRSTIRLANAEYLNQAQAHSQIALKAQNQCRQTLATLIEMKNPHRTTFIKNHATNQQINVGQPAQVPENFGKSANELLSEATHATLDTRGTSQAIPVNQEMETVGAIYRSQD